MQCYWGKMGKLFTVTQLARFSGAMTGYSSSGLSSIPLPAQHCFLSYLDLTLYQFRRSLVNLKFVARNKN